jgi:hypothetical protein
MKNRFTTIIAMLFVTAACCLNSCTDETNAPFNGAGTPATVTIKSAGDTTATAFSVTITPSANAAAYAFAIGTPSDYALFVSRSSSLKTLKEVAGNKDTTITFKNLSPDMKYAVFAQAITTEGYRGEITSFTVPTQAAWVSVHIDEVHSIYAVVTVEMHGDIGGYTAVSASKEMYSEFVALYAEYGYSEEEFLEAAGFRYDSTATDVWLLSGYTNDENVFVVLPYATDGTPLPITYTEYASPAFVPGLLPPAQGTITVNDITDTTAHVVIKSGEGTFGYYVSAVSGIAEATPEDWRYMMYEYLPFYTSPIFGDEDDVWRGLEPGTEYVIGVTPFNLNGADGYGSYYLSSLFKTTGTAPAPAPGANNIRTKPLLYKKSLTKEALEEPQLHKRQ